MNDELLRIFKQSEIDNEIRNEEYGKWGVKKGLRNEDNTGVLIGLTRIADVIGYKMVDGKKEDDEGRLIYRGIPINQITDNLSEEPFQGFEEISFLILFGHLPNREELEIYKEELKSHYELPVEYLSMNILSNPSMNVMNKIQRSLLMLYEIDDNPDDSSPENTIRQGRNVIAKMQAIMV